MAKKSAAFPAGLYRLPPLCIASLPGAVAELRTRAPRLFPARRGPYHFFTAPAVIETVACDDLFQPWRLPAAPKWQRYTAIAKGDEKDEELQLFNSPFEKPSLGFSRDEFERVAIGQLRFGAAA